MGPGFSGEVAAYYARFRRGYPEALFDALQAEFALGEGDTVLDLGCGTGQLTVPLAARVGAVIGMDPEPDMLRRAREAATGAGGAGAARVTWVLGADTDVPALGALTGPAALGATVVGRALHWMNPDALFRALLPLTRAGGGIAVVAGGAPLWLQDSDWSRALRGLLEEHVGRRLTATCGTAEADRERYAAALKAAGYTGVREAAFAQRAELSLDHLVGEMFSAMPPELIPGAGERPAFAERLRLALPHPGPFVEEEPATALTGRVPVR